MLTIEMTDTFGGETNYSWVKRIENFEINENWTYQKTIKEIKKALEIEGAKFKLHVDCGDFKAWDIKGACIRVMLITNY